MRTSKFTEIYIVGMIKGTGNDAPVSELCLKHDVGQCKFNKWRPKYGGCKLLILKAQN
ncbi:hypothetical protein N474_03295 [Pseudoalteromonas luteoviolacea CPMOR-2]|uniref:transposase n=1 Tax=Pseudoalteromonas luteoviolacea TaxID=43657 RepID=UPI0007B16D0E|nr:transposase [Pseudoalteromonas luteoviolacea]KZN51797.1 hypothetical protein N474_03295 [Pseudoalteromonas luteoviolacea CPMOR-2]